MTRSVPGARRAPWQIAAMIAAMLMLMLPPAPGPAATFTLSDLNSEVLVEPGAGDFFSPPGLYSWNVDGVEHVWEMLWFVAVDDGPRMLVNDFDLFSAFA